MEVACLIASSSPFHQNEEAGNHDAKHRDGTELRRVIMHNLC